MIKRGRTQQEREGKGRQKERIVRSRVHCSLVTFHTTSLTSCRITDFFSRTLHVHRLVSGLYFIRLFLRSDSTIRIRVSAHSCDTHSKQDGSFTSLFSGPLSPPLLACASPVAQSVLGDAQGEHHLPAAVTGRHRRLRLFRGPSRRVADDRERGGGGGRIPGGRSSHGGVSAAEPGSRVSLHATWDVTSGAGGGRSESIQGAAQTTETVEEW